MKKILASSLLALLVACGGGGSESAGPVDPPTTVTPPPPPPPPPTEGTVLSSECEEYTLVEQVADGQGGSTERVTPRAEACGWNPPPYGELYATECEEPYTLVSTYHDGEYGYYDEREEDSEQCGYIPPSLEVTIDNTYGDRFRPVIVTVDYRVQGEPAEWTYYVELGRAVKVDDNTLHIYGSGEGNSVDLILEINGESFLYQLKREPRCAVDDATDCLGHVQFGGWDLIYYGEGDTLVVPVQIALTLHDPTYPEPTPLDPSYKKYAELELRVEEYNKRFEADGIFIRFELVGIWMWANQDLRDGERFIRTLDADIGLGLNTTYAGTCGVAYPNTRFSQAGFGFSACGYKTDLHELGHVVGLAHGPNNPAYPQEGYIFPEFGHGDYDQCNGSSDDIMSYGSKTHFFNSEKTCAEVFPDNPYLATDGPAGDRFRADSAFHWNRVRYDLSLVYDEHIKKDPAVARSRVVPLDDDRPLIID